MTICSMKKNNIPDGTVNTHEFDFDVASISRIKSTDSASGFLSSYLNY